MFITEQIPTGRTDLATGLANMDRDTFPHVQKLTNDVPCFNIVFGTAKTVDKFQLSKRRVLKKTREA